jgi:hypothetical protein
VGRSRAGVVQAAAGGARGLCERHCLQPTGKKIEWRRREGLGAEAGQTTRQGREAQPGPLGHDGGRGVLGLGYMGLVGSNVFMGFISGYPWVTDR